MEKQSGARDGGDDGGRLKAEASIYMIYDNDWNDFVGLKYYSLNKQLNKRAQGNFLYIQTDPKNLNRLFNLLPSPPFVKLSPRVV